MKWKIVTGQYSSGERLYLGRWEVGGFYWNSCRSQSNPGKWSTSCGLPGIKANLGNFQDEKEAKKAVEDAVNHWLSGAKDL